MAKGSGRFRNRKLGFKTRINVAVGVVIEDDPIDADLDIEDDKGHKGVETGVDKDEEGEFHLQAVIASSAAAVAQSSASGARADKGKKPEAFIPTRASETIPEAEYRALYKPGWVDPFSYIRFSDTVEDAIKGAVNYTMDEDDEDWLEDYNAQFQAGAKHKAASSTAEADPNASPSGRGARSKGKGADKSPSAPAASTSTAGDASSGPFAPLSEDDFELIMEVFETVTDQKAPMAHVNINLLPSLDDFDAAFDDPLRPTLAKLGPYAKDVYPHWKERRVDRGGKPVFPQLDYDESNEANPYVCFRRRDVKTARKTRRSDQQNLERLVRLRNDLYAAHALMVKVQERERLKLDAIELERRILDGRCEMRELKRRLNEPDGDEDLLISRKERKRKRDDQMAGSLRIPLGRKTENILSPSNLVPSLEELQARKQRNEAILKQIERDLVRKRQGDQFWDDWTDSAYVARPPPTPARFWRTVEPVPNSVPFGSAGRREALGFATQYQPPLGRVRTSFRKRVGRGGRILLDRIGPARRDGELPSAKRRLPPASDGEVSDGDEEDEWLVRRRRERLKYDTDVGLDFPTADEPTLLDDFEVQYLMRRVALIKPQDLEQLSVDSAYLEEAFKFVAQDPDKHAPPPVTYGRPPPRPPLQMAPAQAAGAALGQAAGAVGAQLGNPSNAAAYAQAQQQLAAQQAFRLAQQQAALRKSQQMAAAAATAGGAGGTPDQMRRTPSQAGSPHANSHSPLANGIALPGGPGQLNMNGVPANYQNHQLASSPIGANGMPLPRVGLNGLAMSGANGLPATSRLSAPPYSNPQALQLAIQAQQQQAAAAAAAAAAGGSPLAIQQLQQGRPVSANGLVQGNPSRPTSAASSHAALSPHMGGATSLPSVGPGGALSPSGLRAKGGLATPPPGMAAKRSSPMGPGAVNGQYGMHAGAQAMKPGQAQYGGFVQG
ncbi:enhancerof polycomb-like protein [Rhodotorula toruloides]|uniref:Enhancer of polycomb-like protein n=1 Tax=Rhodotorula toruloides TaxID=5286 RepID=A0A511KGP7_RHOTO|nr:enhancerof polycomb-like protein [Rhodotorula toruloides]